MHIPETPEEDKLKRQGEIERILNQYIARWNAKENVDEIYAIDSAATKITETYFKLLHDTIKVYLPKESNANKFKVASGTELACMSAMPLKFADTTKTWSETKYINARFAVFAATNVLFAVNFNHINEFKPTQFKERLNKVNLGHITWLRYYDISDITLSPTFLNANYWEAFLLAATTE